MTTWTARLWRCALGALGFVALGLSSVVMAGDTDPPPGPIMGTFKTLEEVEPRIDVNALPGDATAVHVISQDGSYMLTADVMGQAGKSGIRVDAGSVTLDLNGFTMHGGAGTNSAIKCSWIAGSWEIVANGTMEGWGDHGVDMSVVVRTHFKNLMVVNCAGGGVVAGDSATVSYVMVEDCGGDGISVGADSMVGHSTAINVTGNGLTLGDGTMCLNSMVNGTGGLGLVGLNAKLRDCMIHNSGLDGVMLLGTTGQMDHCEIRGSGGDGIKLMASGVKVDRCTVVGSTGRGAVDGSDFNIWNITKISSSGIDGLVLQGMGTIVTGCAIEGSTGVGLIGTPTAAHIRETTICANGMGIHAQAGATNWTIADCNVSGNAGVGLQIDDSGARITGCHVMGNMGSALLADGAGCLVSDCTISADGVSTPALVRIGDAGTLAGCAIDVSNSTFIDAPVHFTGVGGSFLDCTVSATSVTATPSIVACGWIEGDWNRDYVSARDCTLTTAIASVQGDGTSIHAGSVRAMGTTSAPAATSITANVVDWADLEEWLTPMVPIGIDVMGSSCTIDGGKVLGVGAGGTGIRVSGGNASTIRNSRITGTGSGPYTGVDVQSMSNVVIANDISVLLGGTAVDNTGGPSNLIGPTINAGNFGMGCDPCGNIVH